MKAAVIKYQILAGVASLIMLIWFLLPFHALATVWLSSHFGHYTMLRLWKEALLLIAGLGVIYLLITDTKIRFHTLTRRLVWLITLYILVNLVWGLIAHAHDQVTAKAMAYGLLINLRFLLFFLIAWAIAVRTSRLQANWQKLLIWPAVLVVLFGLLQLTVLPHDVLRHFGYGDSTIPVMETINHNSDYPRLQSSLRGPNPLGAYMVIIVTALTTLYLQRKGRGWLPGLMLIGSALVLLFSYSRSAWVGAGLSLLIILGVLVKTSRAKKVAAISLGVLAAGLLITAVLLRHNAHFQNIVFHTQDNSIVKTTSNSGHLMALRNGLSDIAHNPLGNGPGSAGPASVYNDHPARIAENYFVQIGEETGWLGILLFLIINAGVGYLLWVRRRHPLALILFASLIGLSFVNLLLHAWTDDTLAYIWWGLAGIAMAIDPKAETEPN